MLGRALIVSACLAATALALPRASLVQAVPLRAPLADLPLTIGEWEGREDAPLARDILDVLGVDDYVSRRYASPAGDALGLYVGFYGSQRQGASVHSPRHCLPGEGWHPVLAGRLTIQDAGGDYLVNRYLVQKGQQRQLVLYWFEGRGRVVASEYRNKLYLMLDSMWRRRTDEALVRVMVPVAPEAGGGADRAESAAMEFVRAFRPILRRHLPE